MGDLPASRPITASRSIPPAAQRIEVVRGPATLLYGANAIGGLVNVITEDIPTDPLQGATATSTFDLGSAAKEARRRRQTCSVGNGKLCASCRWRRPPLRRCRHARGRSRELAVAQRLRQCRRSSWTGAKGYFGGSYGYDDTKYGIPVVEEGHVQLTPRKHAFSLRGGAQGPRPARSTRSAPRCAVRRYKHEELVGEEVGTAFKNNTDEARADGIAPALGRLKGSVGGWVLDRAFDADRRRGAVARRRPERIRGVPVRGNTWPHVTFQFGGRLDRTNYEPPARTSGLYERFGLGRPAVPAGGGRRQADVRGQRGASRPQSGARGAVLLRPAPGKLRVRDRQSRISNPSMRSGSTCRSAGVGRAHRAKSPISGTTSATSCSRRPSRTEEFEERDRRVRGAVSRDAGIGEQKKVAGRKSFPSSSTWAPTAFFRASKPTPTFQLTPQLFVELGLDYVRGTLKETDEPLPRIPPLAVSRRASLSVQRVSGRRRGDRRGEAGPRLRNGDATDGYQLCGSSRSYTFGAEMPPYDHRAPRQRDERAVPKPPVAHQGSGAGDGPQFKLLYNVKF